MPLYAPFFLQQRVETIVSCPQIESKKLFKGNEALCTSVFLLTSNHPLDLDLFLFPTQTNQKTSRRTSASRPSSTPRPSRNRRRPGTAQQIPTTRKVEAPAGSGTGARATATAEESPLEASRLSTRAPRAHAASRRPWPPRLPSSATAPAPTGEPRRPRARSEERRTTTTAGTGALASAGSPPRPTPMPSPRGPRSRRGGRRTTTWPRRCGPLAASPAGSPRTPGLRREEGSWRRRP